MRNASHNYGHIKFILYKTRLNNEAEWSFHIKEIDYKYRLIWVDTFADTLGPF